MRRLLGKKLLLLFCVAAAGVASGTELVDDPAARTRTHVLANGLSVLTLEDPATPVVSFQMWVRVGSGDETRTTGLAHLFEHMMFRGTSKLGPEQHERLIEARGGRINAFTSRDVTVYFDDVTAEHLPLVIELEAERLAHLEIDEASLASEREVVLEERRLRTEDSPQGRAWEALFALLFQAHPYGHPTIGWRSDVESIGVRECRRFFDTFYAANNVVIAIVGDFDADAAIERIERVFGGIPSAGEIPRSPTREPRQRGERRSVVHFDVQGPILAAAWPAPPSGHPDAEALDVASQILSGGRSARLHRRLVYEAQVALSARSAYYELRDAGVFSAFVAVRPDGSIDRAERLLMEELGRLRKDLVTPEELEKAKRGLEVGLVSGLATSHSLASRIASEYVILGRVRPLAERLEAIRSVSAEDVRRVAAAYLLDSGRNVVHVVPGPAGTAP